MSKRWVDTLFFFGLIAALSLVNVIGSQVFTRLDLTADGRYTIMPATRRLLDELPQTVYVEVFLEGGELPAGFERLRSAIRETLDEFRVYGGDRIQYSFTDPSAAPDAKTRAETYQTLARRGLQPTNLQSGRAGARSEQIIFPGAIVRSGEREVPVLLLKGNQTQPPATRLNQSVENVEYELALAINKVTRDRPARLAVISGHGERVGLELNDLAERLRGLYELEKVDLPRRVSLEGFDAALIVKPDTAFSEADKYKLDQMLMRGGRLAYFLDAFPALRLDSIKPDGTILLPAELNLSDQLFTYGARVNADLVLDINSGYIPMVTRIVGDQPQTELVPWRFYPIVNTFAPHPITRNMDALWVRFGSSIDTVRARGIRKTVLASTGRYSRLMAAPVRMSFNEARLEPRPEQYNRRHLPVAVLLEGRFTSHYRDRLTPDTEGKFAFVPEGTSPGSVLLVSDGDLPLNEVNEARRTIVPLGYDRVAGVTFANGDFIVNSLAYMLDREGLILARTKEITLRPLDRPRLDREGHTRWQVLNLAVPLMILGVFGGIWAARRRRLYGRPRR